MVLSRQREAWNRLRILVSDMYLLHSAEASLSTVSLTRSPLSGMFSFFTWQTPSCPSRTHSVKSPGEVYVFTLALRDGCSRFHVGCTSTIPRSPGRVLPSSQLFFTLAVSSSAVWLHLDHLHPRTFPLRSPGHAVTSSPA